jgi:Rps23 Pro-64 3,4-dihydroxylase Tpa1-like proline 4-hydroxylase
VSTEQAVSTTGALDLVKLEEIARTRRDEFINAEPYPHIVIEDFLPIEVAEKALAEFDDAVDGWNHYYHYNEKKLALTDVSKMGPTVQAIFDGLQSRPFVDLIEKLSGIDGLLSDPALDGAGMHVSRTGGYLNVHTDFLTHTSNRSWSRQINVIIFFNKDWDESWGGALELWDADMTHAVKSVMPVFNRCVIFNTRPKSYHGHPHPMTCPPNRERRSIAHYLFRDEGAPLELRPTDYRPLPTDKAGKRALVAVDRGMVRTYSFLKRYLHLKDGLADRLLKFFK